MSQDVMDPELFSDFIIEAKEHLETIEPNLLELEKSPDNLALLNEIFRPMHSLKGASGFLGLNKINQLAHKAENILDELRKGEMVITSEIMDVILSATDALSQMINNLEGTSSEGDVEIESIMELIDSIMRGELDTISVSKKTESEKYELVSEVIGNDTNMLLERSNVVSVEATLVEHIEVEHIDIIAENHIDPPIEEKKIESTAISAQEWINNLTPQEAYSLIAFGEGHLKDFIDEAKEITENLTTGLLAIEKDLGSDPEIINDLFRYFHNLKGNSGIIGFHELNSLTHEAETLLNQVRHGEMTATHELIDLLLLVVDVIDSLVEHIESSTGIVQPFDISELLKCLQSAVAGEIIALPKALSHAESVDIKKDTSTTENDISANDAHDSSIIDITTSPTESDTVTISNEKANEIAFAVTVQQQQATIQTALAELAKNSTQKEYIDALYRSVVSIQNAAGVMGFEELKVYAERTAALIAQGRDSGIDFSLMLDILKQEISIVNDMISVVLAGDGLEPYLPSVQKENLSEQAVSNEFENKKTAVIEEEEEKTKQVKLINAPIPESPKAEGTQTPITSEPVVPSVPNTVKSPKSTPTKAAQTKPGGAADASEQKSSSTIRVDHEKLDHLMNLIGELIINRNRYTMLARRLEAQGSSADLAEVAQDLSETTYAMARISDELQDTIMKVRMVPVASVFSRFPRLVRDLSRKSGKEVELVLEGEETELDKSVVEVIGDPLVHLIRNSVDHGIEPEAERIAKGKPVKGKVTLRAYHKGNSVAIEIEDDGKGLEPEKLREVAVNKGILTVDEAKQLDDREAMELIFAPGFSSAEKITDISGRGVGMDVVRTNIKNLKGSISIHSEVGKGTRFTLSLPLTLAIIDALMVNVAGEMFAIPLDAVSETTKLEASRLNDINGRKAITLRGEVLGLIELGKLLNLPQEPLSDVLSVVIIHNNERRLGLVVDKLLERQEIVIKPLGSYLGDIPCISGATIMGDGGVILILDPHEIYTLSTTVAKSA